ncbi:MAG: alpha-1,4-glucan--maltose-1-phosphate maltosyltransferase [Candidatus Riflebacteria bacterium HGW-Riflebacteria-1]|jgi:starch synthase (maltosyl-transferring)|nr:MAG: alpha-1,4-glucan--maltose-1-phosphate maltosyltransferase [Candidatus Riflebacteria bacterium HGW-Riflebacteria-1]
MSRNRKRVLIENVRPAVDAGLYPLKRELGDEVQVTADIFRDGHDKIAVWVEYRPQKRKNWQKVPMQCVNPGLDLWETSFKVDQIGVYEYKIVAYCEDYGSWILDTRKKVEAATDYASDLLEGIAKARNYGSWLTPVGREVLKKATTRAEKEADDRQRWQILSNERLVEMLEQNPDPAARVESQVFLAQVDRVKARFAAWYECFPRSCGFEPGVHGTFKDVIKRLPHIAEMGFDVLYFPPIHPVGFSKRKGPNNSLVCAPGDPGCPYSIGSQYGGHDAIEPALGTFEDFAELVEAADKHGIEIALDFAINCSPDHPYLKQHPDWFSKRPDGTIKFAENPPKKYEDIYPINFESADYKSIWKEMLRIFLFWAKRGVKIFRVDNPHTKPFAFWHWVIAEVQDKYPDVVFLAEAFTRPKVMKALAKLGFTQSYSYFTWRNTQAELIEYFSELTTPPESYYYRANLFANTPDIFPPFLQSGGRPAYKIRAVLAATLSTVYGIFQGFELCEGVPVPGKEEYLHSDKYEIRTRDWKAPGNICDLITRMNKIRREHPALQEYDNLKFFESENDRVLFYGKSMGDDHILVVINLDPFIRHSAFVHVPLEHFGLTPEQGYQMHDLLTDRRYLWYGSKNYVELDPQAEPAHVFVLRK